MKELLALFISALIGFAVIWLAILGFYLLFAGLALQKGDVFAVVGFILILASPFLAGGMSYYLRGKPSFYKNIVDRFKKQ